MLPGDAGVKVKLACSPKRKRGARHDLYAWDNTIHDIVIDFKWRISSFGLGDL
jgi:hypothetical protein